MSCAISSTMNRQQRTKIAGMTIAKKLINQSGSFEDKAIFDWQPMELWEIPVCIIIIIIMYLYSAQYLHILQDSKRYLTNPTVQVQS